MTKEKSMLLVMFFFYTYSVCVYICTFMCILLTYTYRGQKATSGVSYLSLQGSWGYNSGPQTQQQVPLPTAKPW